MIKQLDCSVDSKFREASKYRFQSAKTVKDFQLLFSLFYLNEICAPTTTNQFYGGEQTDNRQADLELGQKFKQIVADYGLIPFDSQANVPGTQKGYLMAFVPSSMADDLADEINRHDNIVAFVTPIYGAADINSFILTYDADQDTIAASQRANKLLGDPYTRVALHTYPESFEQISDWMSEEVQAEINPGTYSILVVVSPSFQSPQTYPVDVTLDALKSL